MDRLLTALALPALLVLGPFSHAAALAPFSTAPVGEPPAPWHVVTLPKVPRHTRFAVVEVDGQRVLRVDVDGSYANLLLQLDAASTEARAATLRWRWRVESMSDRTDITRKSGDDVPARVCVLFDLPLDRLDFGARWSVRLGRALFDPALPAATLCYIWDAHVAPGTWLPSAYTGRVMQQVLQRGDAGTWKTEARDLRRDFAAAFPFEAANGPMPPIAAIGIAGDGDNTGARSRALVGDVELTTP